MLHGARDRGDREQARELWLRIVVAELERVRGIVRAYEHHALPGGRVPRDEVDDVAQDVFLRLHDRVDSLKGRSIGELRKFMSTATKYACLDYVDAHIRADKHRGGSLDAGADGVHGGRASDRALAELAAQLAADDDAAQIARAVVHPTLALVDDNKRAVLILTLDGCDVPEIQERLGLSRDNVYQLRKRGLKQLGEAIRELAEEDEEQ